jgi:Skp family chaperone for outer membrane proteins
LLAAAFSSNRGTKRSTNGTACNDNGKRLLDYPPQISPAEVVQMALEKEPNTGNPVANSETAAANADTGEREKKIINATINTSIILMSTLMGAFTEIAVTATGAVASGLAETISGKEAGDQVQQEIKQKQPEIGEKMKKLVSDMRKDVYAQFRQKAKEMKPLLSDSLFDTGPKIIEKYDFKLPKLTEELDDATLAQYTQLLTSGDPNFTEMFKELTTWLNSLPKSTDKIAKP